MVGTLRDQANYGDTNMTAILLEKPEEILLPAGIDLTGRTALVTGASRGIGKAIALALAQAGADVAVSCNTAGNLAEEVCDTIKTMGRKSAFYAHSIDNPAEVEKLHTE